MCAAAPPPLGLIEPGDGAFRFIGEDFTLYPPPFSRKVVTGVPSEDTPIEKLLVAVKAQDVVCTMCAFPTHGFG